MIDIPSLQDGPRIAAQQLADVLRITCPYCVAGFAEVLMVRKGDIVQVEHINDPRKCFTCGRYFKLQPRVVLEGVRMER